MLRHDLTDCISPLRISDLIKTRDIEGDIGKKTNGHELKRNQVVDIFYANSQRSKESVRVLEEFTKLLNKNTSERLKMIRYKVYGLEKRVAQKL